nr:hypothetical protein B0A51_01930 [Rachicladosporium sp. CCFEE 5018]
MNSGDADSAEAECLLSQYISQLTKGCRKSSCENQQCATGRRNTSPRPVRDYKIRTARLIAIQILSGEHPRRHLCNLPEDEGMVIQITKSQLDDARDPSSSGQRLSDSVATVLPTTSIESTIKVLVPALGSAAWRLREARLGLKVLFIKPYGRAGIATPDYVDDKHAVELLIASWLSAYTAYTHGESQAEPFEKLVELFQKTTMESRPRLTKPRGVLDVLTDNKPYRDCLEKICETIAFRCTVADPRHENTSDDSTGFEVDLLHGIEKKIAGPAIPQVIACLSPLKMLQYVFKANYDGQATVKPGSIAHGTLIWMGVMLRSSTSRRNFVLDWSRYDPRLLNMIAEAWLAGLSNPRKRRPVILLEFPFLFNPNDLYTALRVICHLRMRDTQSRADLIDKIFDRYNAPPTAIHRQPISAATLAEQRLYEVAFRREKYLVLLVSREEVLRDTFDQLWQRRRSELLCPLRIHLGGEVGEIGQDLGGVQVEFFNLVCRAVLKEEAGMFTTDATTGLSWLRIGSLQPLHMFELLGALLALAIHNGIAIPVSFPLALYKHLLDLPIDGLDDIADAWPVKKQTLVAFIEADLDDDHVYHLSANGLDLEIGYSGFEELYLHRRAYEEDCRNTLPMLYLPTSPSAKSRSFSAASEPDDADTVDWPGWTVGQAPVRSDIPTRGTNQQYALDYVEWLTTLSVYPQLHALQLGFHSVLPAPLLAFLTARQLRAALEGTPTLSIHDWRRSTTYTAFSPTEPYIESFWRIVASWPLELQRGLLRFVTSAERVAVSGSLTFNISRIWGQAKLLPTSSTCYCILNLPLYESEAVLEQRLRTAIEWGGEGFGQA